MNSRTKNILTICAVVVVVAYMVAAIIVGYTRPSDTVCQHLVVQITDHEQRQYLTTQDLHEQLRRQGLYPVGKNINDISTQRIEQSVLKHDAVRTAQCYLTPKGDVCIRLTQRVPLLKIVTAAEAYYIDTDRLRMPLLPTVQTRTLTATGNIGQRMAENELAELAQWLTDNDYWCERIASIRVETPKMVILVQKDGARIILGEPAEYAEKMHKLRMLYDKGLSQLADAPTYHEYDLRFNKQVVTR